MFERMEESKSQPKIECLASESKGDAIKISFIEGNDKEYTVVIS